MPCEVFFLPKRIFFRFRVTINKKESERKNGEGNY